MKCTKISVLRNLEKVPEPGRPFVVVDDVTYISEAFIKDGSISKAKIGDNWSVKTEEWSDGRKYVADISAGINPQVAVGPG
ncbi:phage tail tip fiber protein [Pseudomonas protegens]